MFSIHFPKTLTILLGLLLFSSTPAYAVNVGKTMEARIIIQYALEPIKNMTPLLKDGVEFGFEAETQ